MAFIRFTQFTSIIGTGLYQAQTFILIRILFFVIGRKRVSIRNGFGVDQSKLLYFSFLIFKISGLSPSSPIRILIVDCSTRNETECLCESSSLRAIWVDSDNNNGKLLTMTVYINIEQAACVSARVCVYPIQFGLKIRFLFLVGFVVQLPI